MRKFGGYMIFFGLFAIILNFFDRVPSILMWIYNWGEGVAWAIKIGLVVVGAILFFMDKPASEELPETNASEPESETSE